MKTKGERWLPYFEEFVADLRINSKEETNPDGGGSPLVLWESQKRFLKEVATGLDEGVKTFYCLKSRQLGVTTVSLAIDIFWVAMHPGLTMAIVSEKDENREKNRAVIKQYIDSFPEDYFAEDFYIIKNNRTMMQFSNGSRFDFKVAGTKNKGTSWGEGEGYAAAHLTEVAAFGSDDGLKSFEEAFAQKNPASIFLYESTAKGFNLWRDKWLSAASDPLKKRAFFIGWWAAGNNSIEKSDPLFAQYGREPPTREEAEKIAIVKSDYDFQITPEQLAWYRYREATDTGGDMLSQNQPWCVRAGTRVGTDQGMLRIEDIRPGTISTLGTVEAAGPTGTAQLWRVRTSLGYLLTGTSNHPLITTDGREVEIASALGEKVKLCPPRFADEEYTIRWTEGVIECAVRVTPEFARLVGIFMGDGSLSGTPRAGFQFSIACDMKDQDVVQECIRLLQVVFGITPQICNYREVGDGGWTTVQVTSKLLYDTFKKLGMVTTENGTTRRSVHVPDFIWRSPKHVVKEFLSGLFEADGFNGYKTPRVTFCSRKMDFVREVQLLLLAFGITSRARAHRPQIKSTGKVFIAGMLELRQWESIKFNQDIGFLSKRKLGRFAEWNLRPSRYRKRMPIVMEDTVDLVEPLGIEEEVYNLTVSGDHLFDANGIVTHNTANEAFVVTGHSFFQTRKIAKDMRAIEDDPEAYGWQGYVYEFGNSFFDMKCIWCSEEDYEVDDIELRVWEDPVEHGKYVIGCDPAYGRNEHKDGIAISVWRCYADKLIQVAEYCAHQHEVRYVAWVLAHLAGAYRDCIVNVELGGGGEIIMLEWDHVRQILDNDMTIANRRGEEWDDALSNARWYLYHRPDTMGAGYAYNFVTTRKTKVQVMESMRGAYTCEELGIRSIPLLREMIIVIRDGDDIAAPESRDPKSKDDRVFAAAFALRAWINWRRPEMITQGLTYQQVTDDETGVTTRASRTIQGLITRFWKQQAELAEAEQERGPTWMIDRGLV